MKEVKKEVEVLEVIYQNILMLKESIISVFKIKVLDEIFVNDLKEILIIYKKIMQAVSGMLKTRNKDVKILGVGEKFVNYVGIKINLNNTNDEKDIARTLTYDINFRTNNIIKAVKEYSKISKTIINLVNRITISCQKCNKKLEKWSIKKVTSF